MHRALKPGGRVAAAVWRAIDLQPYFAAMDAALRECVPTDQADPYGMPFRWPRAAELESTFRNERFTSVSVVEVRHPITFEGGIAQALSALAASPIATTIAELDPDTRARLWSAAERRLSPLHAEGQVRTQMVSNFVTARKAG
ncbi:MAG TPA: hypothetical protein VHK65_14715 [Candidatus Dormibacteraeota bacterium]|nr:hypothetical protein [Candidatus Dormibacteraeota bacterium]